EGDAEGGVRATTAGATETRLAIGEPPSGPGGASALAISGNNRRAAFMIYPTAAEAEKARKDRKTPPTRVTVVELATGAQRSFERVRSFRFAGDASSVIALQHMQPDSPGGSAGGSAATGAGGSSA